MKDYKRLTERDMFGNADIIDLSTEKLYSELCFSETNLLTKALNKLAFLEDKLENRTLIELPIPYGTELHFLYSREHYGKPQTPCIYSTKEWIFNVRYDGKTWFSVAGRGIGYFGEYLHEIGKTVFLTKAEAEAKLKELMERV